jgi:hypothetical protein
VVCEYVECVREVTVVEETVHLVNEAGLVIRVARPYWDRIQVSGAEREAFWRHLDEDAWRVSHSTWSEDRTCFSEDGWELGGSSTPVPAPVLGFRPSVGVPAGWSGVCAPEV